MILKGASIALLMAAAAACGSPASPSRNELLPLQRGEYELTVGAYLTLPPLLLATAVACPSALAEVSFSVRITLQQRGASWEGVPDVAADGTVRVVLHPWDGADSHSGVTRGSQMYTGTVTGVMQQVVLSRVMATATFGGGQSPVPITGTMLGAWPQTIGTVGGTVAFSTTSASPFTCGPGQTNLGLRLVAPS